VAWAWCSCFRPLVLYVDAHTMQTTPSRGADTSTEELLASMLELTWHRNSTAGLCSSRALVSSSWLKV
jgi:hypothetical protein